MSIFMETTEISPERTIGEIQGLLAEYGASQVLTEFVGKTVSAVSFKYPINGSEIPFRLPCRWEPIFGTLQNRRRGYGAKARFEEHDKIQARRVAWRQILRWVQAQLALVDTRMVKVEEVFLPYMQSKNGKTFYEALEARDFNLQLEMKP